MTSAQIIVRRYASFREARTAAGMALNDEMQPGPFDRLLWFETLHASSFSHAAPVIMCATQGQGAAQAQCWLILVENDEDGIASLTNWYSFWHRPQFVNVPDGIVRSRLVMAIAQSLREQYSRLVLHPIIDHGDNIVGQLTRGLRLGGWSVIPRVMGHKRLIDIAPGTRFADYWAKRPGPLRTTHSRKSQRYPLTITVHDRLDDARWSDFRAIFAASWKPRGDDFDFLRAFAEQESATGRLRLGFAHMDGRPVATELWTIDNRVAYIHKLAFDESAAEASPGTQLSYAMFAYAIDQMRVRAIDFGTGDNAYKANWIPDVRPVIELDAFDLRRPETWRPALSAGISALRPARIRSQTDRSPRRAALERAALEREAQDNAGAE